VKLFAAVAALSVYALACGQKIASQAIDPEIVPSRDLQFEQRLDAQIPLDAHFVDNKGERVVLGDYFREKPVVLGLIYYKCPSLCNQVLNGLLAALKMLNFTTGNEFELVMVGIDEREKPATADAKLLSYLNQYDRDGAEKGWHFLTGDPEQIKRVAKAVGYSYKFDVRRDQYAHPAGVVVVTPEGKTAKYFLGVEYSPRDLKLALMDASEERVGSIVDQAVAYCFLWDADSGRYSLAVMRIIQGGGILTVICLAGLLVYLVRHSPAQKPEREQE
jgi:protein SCO1/2